MFHGATKRINVQRSYEILIKPKSCPNVQYQIQSHSDLCANFAQKPRPNIIFRKLETLKSDLIKYLGQNTNLKSNLIRNFKKSVYPKSNLIQNLLEKSKSEI